MTLIHVSMVQIHHPQLYICLYDGTVDMPDLESGAVTRVGSKPTKGIHPRSSSSG